MVDGATCPGCGSCNTVETGPDGEMLCASCGTLWIPVEVLP